MIRLALLLALGVLVAGPVPAPAEIYRWTDEQGVERFSDRIENVPEAYRKDVTRDLRSAERVAPDPPPEAPAAVPPAEDPLPLPGVQLPDGAPTDWAAPLLAFGVAAAIAAAVVGIGLWLALAAFALRLACRLVGEEVPSFARACGVSAVQMAAGVALGVVLAGVALLGLAEPASLAFQGVQMLATFLVNAGVIAAMLGLGFGRALVIALLALVVAVVLGGIAAVAIGLGLGALTAARAG
jgi:hypothetical protein